MDIEDDIVRGVATILWASAWADHVENTQCRRLYGVEITDAMPEIPQDVMLKAARLVGRVEGANGKSAWRLVLDAAEADGHVKPGDYSAEGSVWDSVPDGYATRFGECLAYRALGHGVSWEDDHAAFPMKVPYEGTDVDIYVAAETACGCGLVDGQTEG